ncbi:MAG: hypothetical protein RLZZ426_317 [Actinomycetota bacterium]
MAARQNRSFMKKFLSVIASVALPLTAFIAPAAIIAPAEAAAPSQVVVHVAGTPRLTNPVGGVDADTGAGVVNYPFVGSDDFGAFSIVPFAGGQTTITIEGTSNWPTKDAEVWIDGEGVLHKSRTAAQGFTIVHFKVPAGNASSARLTTTERDTVTTNIEPVSSTDTEAIFHITTAEDARKVEIQPFVNSSASGSIRSFDVSKWGAAWISTAWANTRTSKAWSEDKAIFHYRRTDGLYNISTETGCPSAPAVCTAWGMHVWTGAAIAPSWTSPKGYDSIDSFGLTFEIPLVEDAESLMWLIHQGDTKDPNPDQNLDLATTGGEVWFVSGSSDESGRAVFAAPVIKSVDADLTQQKAIWIDDTTIAWPSAVALAAGSDTGNRMELLYSEDASIKVEEDPVTGELIVNGNYITYDITAVGGLSSAARAKFPHLSSYKGIYLPQEATDNIKNLVTGQTAVVLRNDSNPTGNNPDFINRIVKATGIQLAPVLDYLYSTPAANTDFGVVWNGSTPTIRVWAPTAQDVALRRYETATSSLLETLPMTLDPATGAWSIVGEAGWEDSYYLYEVDVYAHSKAKNVTNLVTDPYSVSLSMNSTRTQVFDPSDARYLPENWNVNRPAFTTLKDATIYELHVRDFSIKDQTVSAENRGTYLAFTEQESNGMKHLKKLRAAGMTHLHLLPVFDIASVNEDKSTWQTTADLSGMAANSEDQQAAVAAIQDRDGFNWGYDPLHFTAPEGSYAVEQNGGDRVLEFRKMIQGVSQTGMRNVMDVVYNHTSGSGQSDSSVFDKIVPGYYHRLAADGTVTTSTCCQNTATENIMMGKFTRESLLTWVKDFKVDGFRFDLMGHQPKSLMLQIRADMNALTIANDGIDGRSIILYGEGWNFGEVQNNARFVQATQPNLNLTGIATYDDRLRDSAKGGGPFDTNPTIQGFASGAYTAWNLDPASGADKLERVSKLAISMDLVKLGLTGTLKSFKFKGADGFNTSGTDLIYNGNQAGYATNPTDAITYVDKHDNEALFDWLAYKLPLTTKKSDRVRQQVLANAIPLMGQGVPFFQAGSDIMRSKSLDKNSYNSGDWFNAIDWSMTDNGFGRGLPMKGDNGSRWEQFATPILAASAAIKPTTADMKASSDRFLEFLKIRYSSPLFRLGTGANVNKRLKFLSPSGSTPGVIAMQILDGTKTIKSLTNLDTKYRSVLIVFNTNTTTKTVSIARDTAKAALHPVLVKSLDAVARKATIKKATKKVGKKTTLTWTASVPARTVSIFVTY